MKPWYYFVEYVWPFHFPSPFFLHFLSSHLLSSYTSPLTLSFLSSLLLFPPSISLSRSPSLNPSPSPSFPHTVDTTSPQVSVHVQSNQQQQQQQQEEAGGEDEAVELTFQEGTCTSVGDHTERQCSHLLCWCRQPLRLKCSTVTLAGKFWESADPQAKWALLVISHNGKFRRKYNFSSCFSWNIL